MSMQSIETRPQQRPKTAKVNGRIKRALDAMVWDCLTDNEAAVQTGMTVTNIRLALRLPHVRAYYHEQLQVLRTRESARNIHTLAEVRDQKSNQMARVQAVKALEQLDDEVTTRVRGGFHASPGLVVNIINTTGEPKPLTVQGSSLLDE